MNNKVFWTIILACMATFCYAQSIIDLSGEWRFATGDKPTYTDRITLPGSMLTNGKGDIVDVNTQWTGSLYDSSYYFNPYMERYRVAGDMKFPFFLTPKRHYVGNAWYEKTVKIPKEWKHRRVVLFLERPHIETTVFVNGKEVGHQMSLSVPHEYDITEFLKYGKQNTIAIKVYNGIENVCVGQDSHSVTDQTQGNWNGIVGRMELRTTSQNVWIEGIRIKPNAIWKSVTVDLSLSSRSSPPPIKAIVLDSNGLEVASGLFEATQDHHAAVTLTLGEKAKLWDEFNPYLYTLKVEMGNEILEKTFGLREITIKGRQFYLNGNPIWLRGTVENCNFPETGFPPTDAETWHKVFAQCKAYGLNHMRFHSYCPPDIAFCVADSMGFYLQPEGPSWPNHGVKLGQGMAIDKYLLDECKAIVDTYGHHPSFVMMAAGNEPAGNWVRWCADFVKEMHEYDSTRVFCGASVGGGWAWDYGSEYHVKAGARGLDWDNRAPHSDDDYYEQILFPRNYPSPNVKPTEPNNTPIIAHEHGQWCAFPDLKEQDQYTGVYKAENFSIFRDLLERNGMGAQAGKFLMASGRLQTLAYKYEIERNLRTPDYAGFQLLGLNDYSGQGTALVGPLNVHWREKGYVNAEQWREFCSPVVPLAKFPKFVFANTDTLRVPIEVYNACGSELRDAAATLAVFDNNGKLRLMRDVMLPSIKLTKNNFVDTLVMALNEFTEPVKLTLRINVKGNTGATGTNHWEFWVYPRKEERGERREERDMWYETDSLDEKAIEVLENGGDVLLTAAGRVSYGNDIRHTYLPVFWNTSWFKMRPPHTTGAYIQSDHPIFADFPTDDWQNLNWWELVNKTQVMNLNDFPKDYQPIVQPIDTWHVSRKLGMLIEAKVLNGRIVMTTMDITSNLDKRIVARQLRYSILKYMQSDKFQPKLKLEPKDIWHLYNDTAEQVNMFTKGTPDELKPALK